MFLRSSFSLQISKIYFNLKSDVSKMLPLYLIRYGKLESMRISHSIAAEGKVFVKFF